MVHYLTTSDWSDPAPAGRPQAQPRRGRQDQEAGEGGEGVHGQGAGGPPAPDQGDQGAQQARRGAAVRPGIMTRRLLVNTDLILCSDWPADTRGGQLQEHGGHQSVRDLPQREGGPQKVSGKYLAIGIK